MVLLKLRYVSHCFEGSRLNDKTYSTVGPSWEHSCVVRCELPAGYDPIGGGLKLLLCSPATRSLCRKVAYSSFAHLCTASYFARRPGRSLRLRIGIDASRAGETPRAGQSCAATMLASPTVQRCGSVSVKPNAALCCFWHHTPEGSFL